MSFYPKVLRAKKRAPTPSPFIVFTFGLTVGSIRSLGVCHKECPLTWVTLFITFLPIGKSRCDVSSGTTQGWIYTKLLVKLIYSLNIITNITMDEIHSNE
jgi:hypothetical protein